MPTIPAVTYRTVDVNRIKIFYREAGDPEDRTILLLHGVSEFISHVPRLEDRLSESGYFRGKIAQEKMIKQSSIPYTIVHATQFFEFLKGLADFMFDGKEVRLPPVLFQPMAADDVASAVAKIAVGKPVNGIVEVGGPEQFRLDELVRRRLASLKDPREVIADPNARYAGAKVSEKTLLPDDNARLGETRFETWLTQPVAQIARAA